MSLISCWICSFLLHSTGGGSNSSYHDRVDERADGWSYKDIDAWGDENPICNNGRRQSPIHLAGSTSFSALLPPILAGNYDTTLSGRLTITNNGHSVEMPIPETTNGARPYITGGTLRSRYEAQALHFHWGAPGIKGSEHTINKRRYDVEMHIVHKNVAYADVAEANKHSDGLAVLGIMLDIANNPDRAYPGLNKILNRLPAVRQAGSTAALNGELTLGQVLGDLNTKRFYTYPGSLTTPGCEESVTWIVFPEPLYVDFAQIEQFWQIMDENGDYLLENYRPLQERNGRRVYYRDGGKRPVFLPYHAVSETASIK